MADFFDRIVILKRTPIFSEVSTDDLRVVVEEMQEEACFKGERIFEINDPSDRMYIVLKGKIGISINPDPKVEDFVTYVEEGGCFGEMGPSTVRRVPAPHTLSRTRSCCIWTN